MEKAPMDFHLHFGKGYIAHPYWPALERYINITKESGISRARTEPNRAKALNEYLTKVGMTVAEFERLKIAASKPFCTVADVQQFCEVDGHDPNEIVIPINQIYGCLVQASDEARAATRIAKKEQIRTVLEINQPLFTGKSAADGVWERFAVVTAGTGNKLSNQRALRSNRYIAGFDVQLSIDFDSHFVDAKGLHDFVTYAGREIGIGASRKLGWGRFSVS
jgi:hypothetical protein